ncbi:MAG: hypothetical protein ACT4QC_07195 [Planctomycetaceae bacterium]
MLNIRIRGIPIAGVPRVLWPPALPRSGRDLHVFFCICDHYEPQWKGHCTGTRDLARPLPPKSVQDERVRKWAQEYPEAVLGICDSIGRPPQHTFFYPEDEYDDDHAEYLDQLGDLCRRGYGDVEVHLHHDGDTAQTLEDKLSRYVEQLHHRHGLLRKDGQGRIAYGFSHGDWALDNSRPDGLYCGVNNEISVLVRTGCYADFTLPSAPSPCQTKTVNSIYYAIDDPARPKSHDTGIEAAVGRSPPPDGLLIIQGPLAFDLSSRKWGLVPRLENGDVSARRPPSLDRFRLWLQSAISVRGREDWVFIKVYTHGAQDPTKDMFLGAALRQFHEGIRRLADQTPKFKYYYVTAWEMANLVHQAEAGRTTPLIGDLSLAATADTDDRAGRECAS